MIELARETLSWALLLGGGFFIIVGGIGVLRFPDFYTRLHPAGITDTAGAALTLFGLMLQGGLSLVTVKLALILLFLLFTSPVASHALANAAFVARQRAALAEDRRPDAGTAEARQEVVS
jgi:multicomponent Na+:H+ antiporter subunit G